MPVLPNGRRQQLQWFNERKSKFISQAENVGLTPEAVLALFAKIDAADTAGEAADVARVSAKDATQTFYSVSNDAIGDGREIIRVVKAFAATQADPNEVLALVGIPAEAPPTPMQAPASPTNIRGSITTDGILTLAWNATESGTSSGIVFLVNRKLPGESEFRLIGATFTKQYIDTTFDPAAGNTVYKVQAQRGSLSSGWSPTLSVDLGIGGGGFTVSSGKLAA